MAHAGSHPGGAGVRWTALVPEVAQSACSAVMIAVAVAAPTDVTLDASQGQPVSATVDLPDAQRRFVEAGLYSAPKSGNGLVITQFNFGAARFYAVPSARKVTDHAHGFLFGTTLSAVPPDSDPAAPVYNLAYWEPGGIPGDTTYEAPDSSLAAVDTRYHAQGATTDSTYRFTVPRYRPGFTGSCQFLGYGQQAPGRRTEYYTARPDVTWSGTYQVSTEESADVEVQRSHRVYRAGQQSAGWNRSPLGPAFGSPTQWADPDTQQPWGVRREGNRLDAAVTLFSGSDPGQYTQPADGVTGTLTLSRDGTVLGTSGKPGIGRFDIPDTPGTYTLRAVAERSVPWSAIGTRADVAWTFREPGATAPAKPLPLFVVRAAGDVDLQGRAQAGRPFGLALTAQSQPGAPGAPGAPAVRLDALTVEASYDDGATWTKAPSTFAGDRGSAVLRHPAGEGFVSLRITARDTGGDAVTQTVTRAYEKR